MSETIYDVEKLRKEFLTRNVKTIAVENINLKVFKQDFLVITGPSGCGKTTLLNLLGLLSVPTSGNVRFMGKLTSNIHEANRAALRRNNIGYIFQNFNLLNKRNVLENVMLPLRMKGMKKALARDKALLALNRVGLSFRKNHHPLTLSGGQQQRVGIARAIVSEPKVIIADEPTGNLDNEHAIQILDLLSEINQTGVTIIMVTHNPLSARYATRQIKMKDGSLIHDV